MASRSTASSSTAVSSRRDTQSSSKSERSSSKSSGTSSPAVESAVTRLLVSIKQLLEALTDWSNIKVDENYVSDVYVRLGNNFNAAVAAFGAFNIDMSELLSIPDDLRNVLEQCLSEDATVENLEVYLPTVRGIITNLLQGLRGKQSIYRRIVSDHRHRSSDQATHQKTESRSSRSSRRDTGHRSQLSRSTVAEDERERPERETVRRSTPTSRRRDGASVGNAEEAFVGGFSPRVTSQPIQEPGEAPSPNDMPNPFERKHASTPPTDGPQLHSPPLPTSTSLDGFSVPTTPPVPANVKRYSLVDKPIAPPSVVVEPSSPDPESLQQQQQQHQPQQNGDTSPPPPPDTPGSDVPPPETPPMEASQAPAMASSLAALKRSETLERRASKRFSTYNISKITGVGGRERSQRGQANRRSLAVSSALTPGELAVLTEVDDEEPTSLAARRDDSRSRSRPVTPDNRPPPVPPLPSTPARTPEPPSVTPEPVIRISGDAEPPVQQRADGKITVFLQLGREVKKAVIEPGLSISSMRMLFVDKFSYNPGLENFPAIYIRDPSSGVQYELEDMDEVKEKCLLSLNIEPLDQIKQHIDTQITSLSQDIKELRSVVANNQRQSAHLSPIMTSPLAESTPAPNRPTDRQFQNVARRLSRFVASNGPTPTTAFSPPYMMSSIQPQTTGGQLQPQMTGGSVLSDYSTRVVSDLKVQFDEVQNLRRDLGIMRQLYTEFMNQTKESLNTLRGQTQSVKQLANSKVGGARGYIDSGKQKLDLRTQNVLTEVEKLQDTVESLKDDVLKRHISPKATHVKTIKTDMETVAAELESLKEHVKTIKPMWKKTWEEELQNIVEEQQFMTHQEEFLQDLIEDHKAVVEVFGHVEQVISLRGTGSGRRVNGRGFRPPPPEEGHGGLSTVMLEIKGANVDPEKRMKAIEANQRNRQKELASRSDELQAELTDFVSQKKLKMTGGAEEAERVRQKRNDMTLKAMFSGGGDDSLGM
ncbi:Bud site selection protein 6 [Paramarasmius palmivorus]|uniref:Bud site selection protein 6 n=1 Tax=Paramarasmius palmivorus TaxID=297713 RepID=A0AAW0E9K1_9AGAR